VEAKERNPEMWWVDPCVLYQAIRDIQTGLEYAKDCLATHDANLGRATRKNRLWAEQIESDIADMEDTKRLLVSCAEDKRP
jgi:hypothetical protein